MVHNLQQKLTSKTYFFHNLLMEKMYIITNIVKIRKTILEFFHFWVVILPVLY